MNKQTMYMLSVLMLAVVAAGIWHLSKSKSCATGDDRIIVGISADFPPFTYMQESEVVGLDIDLMREIGKRLHKEIVFTDMPFGTLLPSLQMGTIEVIAGGLTATPERAKHVLFTDPYLERDALLVVSLSSAPIKSLEELKDKEIVVNEGYTADLYISALPEIKIMRLKSPAEAILALRSGRVAAFVSAYNAVKPFFDQYEADAFHGFIIPDTTENASLAVAPQCPELQKELQKVIQSMKADGSMQTLLAKWGVKQ
jgi:polar amino acid transport system substrate-binding protein